MHYRPGDVSREGVLTSGGQLFVLGVEIGHGPRLLAALGNLKQTTAHYIHMYKPTRIYSVML